jgi:AraC family transcriptional regulator, regulatory protein of adaptative response / DNA-3-methyladenine glycosylase II
VLDLPVLPVDVREELSFRPPLVPDNLFGHLVATGVPGVEEWRDGAYRRTVRLPHGPGIIALSPGTGAIGCRLALADRRDVPAALALSRFLLDLDADPVTVDGLLRTDPRLAALVDRAPGRRVPRTADGAEFAIRAVLGQQVSTAAARTHAGRLVRAHGEPIRDPDGGLTHLFPQPAALAELDPATLAVPGARRRALIGLIHALGSGAIEIAPDGDWDRIRAQLHALPGIGPWTVETVAMRALGDPDAFIPTDLGVRVLAGALGLPTTPGALTAHAAGWRPWRAYAVQYLWASGDHAVNLMPGG